MSNRPKGVKRKPIYFRNNLYIEDRLPNDERYHNMIKRIHHGGRMKTKKLFMWLRLLSNHDDRDFRY